MRPRRWATLRLALLLAALAPTTVQAESWSLSAASHSERFAMEPAPPRPEGPPRAVAGAARAGRPELAYASALDWTTATTATPRASLSLLQAATSGDLATGPFRRVRRSAHEGRISAGYWLLGWGVANALGGGLAAVLGRDDEAWVGAGVTAASFGVVNGLLALPLLDLSGARERQIAELRIDDAAALQKLRDEQLVAELESGQFYAVNLGLDVAYITAGVFLYVLGSERSPELPWAQGAGLCAIGQGAFLFAFDLISWLNANARAERYRALERPW